MTAYESNISDGDSMTGIYSGHVKTRFLMAINESIEVS
jgi:hypothetical protein